MGVGVRFLEVLPAGVLPMPRKPSSDEPIDLASLGESPGMPGLTATAGRFLAEAAAVCLDHCGHDLEVELSVIGWKSQTYRLHRVQVNEQTIRAYADLSEATEHGACALAILVTRRLGGLEVIERSVKGTGFDYWIGEDEHVPFELKTRLEVSGILRGTRADVERRAVQKCHQTERSDGMGLDAVVFVVEFSQPLAKVVKR